MSQRPSGAGPGRLVECCLNTKVEADDIGHVHVPDGISAFADQDDVAGEHLAMAANPGVVFFGCRAGGQPDSLELRGTVGDRVGEDDGEFRIQHEVSQALRSALRLEKDRERPVRIDPWPPCIARLWPPIEVGGRQLAGHTGFDELPEAIVYFEHSGGMAARRQLSVRWFTK